MRMSPIRRHVDEVDLHGKQARIRHLKADELNQLFPHCFRYSPGSTFVHSSKQMLDVGFWMLVKTTILYIHSTTALTSCGPKRSAASFSTVWSTTSPCACLDATVTPAIRPRCQRP